MQIKAKSALPMTSGKQKISLLMGFLLALIARFPFASAEDVSNARDNLIKGGRTDFWGSFSPWFFTRMRGEFWEEAYALLFALMITTGAFLLMKALTSFVEISLRIFVAFFFLYYCSMLFALDFSRDGALLSFFWLGLGSYLSYRNSKNYIIQNLYLANALLSFTFALLFRPWMAPVFVIVLVLVNVLSSSNLIRKMSIKCICISSFFIVIAPINLDFAFNSVLDLERSYPEQQVVIMDLASIGCLSSSPNVSTEALGALSPIVNQSPVRKVNVCSQYYPSSVGSVLFYPENWGNTSPAVQLISVNNQDHYEAVRSDWLNLLISNPKDYLQVKILLGSQWLLAGDSNIWGGNTLQALLLSPLSIARELRIFSGLFTLVLLLGLLISSGQRKFYLSILLLYLSSLVLLTIAFTGDNQRYILPFSMISFLCIVCQRLNREQALKTTGK